MSKILNSDLDFRVSFFMFISFLFFCKAYFFPTPGTLLAKIFTLGNRGELYRTASIFPPGNKSRKTYTQSQTESHRHTHTPNWVNTLIDRHTHRDTLEDNWMSRLMEKYHEMTNLSDDLSHFSANFSLRLYTEKKTNNVVQRPESPILERISQAFP